ncbi:MAG: asparagine synthase C-terminal domain-containing protein [Nanoarchaeota archaeon]|nr:asparagine synthase C-terminal domain-containing protein [Nanoarchaeota archaeon]MBU1004835.1 asparagine synthase C-terminal domain-containing protein [Nanoarchaeota archaeon]MBU1946773.1 asparagine synthase C-terminal domain-containing protein [Nanoarchaeota archaeon]
MADRMDSEKEWKLSIRKFSIKPEHRKGHKEILDKLTGLVLGAIKNNLPNERFGILFSGGVDSTLIAQVCKKEKKDFICYTSALEEKGLKEAEDLEYAKKAAKKFGFKLKVKTIGLKETEKYIKKILKIIKEPNVVKVGVALPFYIAYELAKKDKIRIMFSGLGSEELFAGYQRHLLSKDINKECFDGLLNMYERDLTRDLPIAKAMKIDLRVPYLDENLIKYSLKIPAEFKLKNEQNKLILREVAEQLGLKEFAWRKKRAAQYGSKFDRAIEKLAKRNGFKYKKDYLKSLLI